MTLTLFQCVLGRSHKTGLIVYLIKDNILGEKNVYSEIQTFTAHFENNKSLRYQSVHSVFLIQPKMKVALSTIIQIINPKLMQQSHFKHLIKLFHNHLINSLFLVCEILMKHLGCRDYNFCLFLSACLQFNPGK